jgi:hypothetical protein
MQQAVIRMKHERTSIGARGALALALALAIGPAIANDRTGGKLLLTAGVSQIEGAAGGGLTPWAVIGGYGTEGQFGGNVFHTRVATDDYRLGVTGLAAGISDRVELSYARQRFDTRDVGAALGLGRGFALEQDVYGAKVRLAGDAILEQDSWLPQIALGVQHKRHRQGDIVRAVGARSANGTDVYLSATKLFLDPGLLLNATLRHTRANQIGILGFGGDRRGSASLQFEGSAALLLHRTLAVGAEYRTKPNNLGIAREDDWWDLFVAWAPTRHVSVTLAYADIGNVVIRDDQRGWYLSVQIGF